jgi:hypothetical protein
VSAESTLHEKLLAELDPAVPWDADRDERAYAALRAVVELHAPKPYMDSKPDGIQECRGCEVDGYEWEYPAWPCSTIQTIARELGVPTEGDDRG